MAQFGYPTSDITRGAWTDQGGGATHWGNLDEVSYSDTDYIQLNNSASNACEVRLNTLNDPLSSTGHTVHMRVQKAGSGTITLTAYIVENTTVRATKSITLTASWADVSWDPTQAEIDSITDYTNLRLRFTGVANATSRYVRVSWANLEIPNVPIDVTSSHAAYLKGQIVDFRGDPTPKSAYLNGKVVNFRGDPTPVPAYLNGIAASASGSKPAYTSGVSQANPSSISAYVLGALPSASSSKSAYLKASLDIASHFTIYPNRFVYPPTWEAIPSGDPLGNIDDLAGSPDDASSYIIGTVVNNNVVIGFGALKYTHNTELAKRIGHYARYYIDGLTTAGYITISVSGDESGEITISSGQSQGWYEQTVWFTEYPSEQLFISLLNGIIHDANIITGSIGITSTYLIVEFAPCHAYLEGVSAPNSTSGSSPAFLAGKTDTNSSAPAFIQGSIIANPDSKSAYTRGSTTPDPSSKPAYTAGISIANGSNPAYITGIAVGSSSCSSYLYGNANVNVSANAYLAGGINVANNKPAYLNGFVAGTQTSSSQAAFLNVDVARDSCPVFVIGIENLLLPDSDLGNVGTWLNEAGSGSNLYNSLDEAQANDADFIYCVSPSDGDYQEFTLTNPSGTPGDGVIIWRGQDDTGSNLYAALIELRQGNTLIASATRILGSQMSTFYLTLTPAELASITDWADLRLRVYPQKRKYPLFFDVRGVHDASLDYLSFMTQLWAPSDFVSCKVTPGTGDVSALDDITFPCIKMSTTTITREDTAIADIVAEALAHGCSYVCLNYEGIDANTALTYFEADQPVVVAAGLKCVCAPIRSVLQNIMGNASAAARFLAVTEFVIVQAQTLQDNPDDGTFLTDLSASVDLIRTRSASIPILFQCSTERPTSAIPAAEIISQAESPTDLDMNNGGFAMWCSVGNWGKCKEVYLAVATDIKKFSI